MRRYRRPLALLTAVLLVSACSPAVTPSPSGPVSASPGSSPSSSASPSPPGAATPCIVATDGALRSTKLIGVSVVSGDSGDLVLFHFGPDAPTGTNSPVGQLEEATPPFTLDPSGLPLEVPGSRWARVRFEGMTLYDESGTPTFTGSDRLDPAGGAAVRAVVQEGEFEGVSSWIIGFDGAGCVTVGIGDATTTVVRVEVVPTP
jgi:hypothetical protein